MGRPLYSKARSTISTSSSRPCPPPSTLGSSSPFGSRFYSYSSSASSSGSSGPSTPETEYGPQHIENSQPSTQNTPGKWCPTLNNFDPDSEEFWSRENTVYEAFLPVTAPRTRTSINVDGTLVRRPADAGASGEQQGRFAYLTASASAREEIHTDSSDTDAEEDEMAYQPITFAPRVAQDTHTSTVDTTRVPIPPPSISINPTHLDDPASPTSPTPLDPSLSHPSPMAVGGDDYGRFFADYERLLHLQARAFEAVAATRAPAAVSANVPAHGASTNGVGGTGVGTGRPPPLALSLSIPAAPATEGVAGTAAMTVHTPTSPVAGLGLGGSRRIRRASAAAAGAGWVSMGSAAYHANANTTSTNTNLIPTTNASASTNVPGSPASYWDTQLPITMDITPIPIPIPSSTHHYYPYSPVTPWGYTTMGQQRSQAPLVSPGLPTPISIPVTPASGSPVRRRATVSSSFSPVSSGPSGSSSNPAPASVTTMMFTPSPAPAPTTPRSYHWDWAAHEQQLAQLAREAQVHGLGHGLGHALGHGTMGASDSAPAAYHPLHAPARHSGGSHYNSSGQYDPESGHTSGPGPYQHSSGQYARTERHLPTASLPPVSPTSARGGGMGVGVGGGLVRVRNHV